MLDPPTLVSSNATLRIFAVYRLMQFSLDVFFLIGSLLTFLLNGIIFFLDRK